MFLPFPSISAANPSFVSTVNFQDSRPATWGSTVWEFLRVSDEQMSNQLGVEHFLFVCFGLFGGFHRKFVGFLSSIGCPWWAVPKSNLSHWRFVHLLLTSTLTRVFWSRCTLPETYISTLNIIGWKMIVSFRIAFRDELLVSRVIINTNCLIHLDSWVDCWLRLWHWLYLNQTYGHSILSYKHWLDSFTFEHSKQFGFR